MKRKERLACSSVKLHTEYRGGRKVSNLFVMFDDGADVPVGVQIDHDDVVRSDTQADDGERGRADEASPSDSAALLERDRVENGKAALDGERQDEAGGIIGEQVAEILLEDAEELDAVDEVERRARKVPAADSRRQAPEQDADEVE